MRAGVSIFRDRNGVAHVQGNSLADLYWGLGYCHGTDRLMQMCLMRTIGQGRICELLNDDAEGLNIDRFFRRMNWSKNVTKHLEEMNVEDAALLESYCKGVNSALAKSYPWEFKLLGYRPEPWKPRDCVLMTRMMGYLTLSQSQAEIERLFIEMVQAGVSKALLDELFPGVLGGFDFDVINKITLGDRIVMPSNLWSQAATRAMASNNWVVSGEKTASGKPMLANDPHLEGNRLPNVWYEVVLIGGDRYMMGGTMPGMPAILTGRNNDVSWGVTYAFVDNIDSWVEQCKECRYFREDDKKWHDFEIRRENISRKNHSTVVMTYFENEHGVLDGDPNVEGHYLATKWSASQSGVKSICAMMNMWSVSNIGQARGRIQQIETGWSFVFADVSGDIGFQMTGSVPVRKAGCTGFVPLAGWDPSNDWQGFYPPHMLPQSTNPDAGYFVTANNDLNQHGHINPINACMASYRADRIAELIRTSKDKLDVEKMRAMQFDLYSVQAELYMAIIKPLLPNSVAGNILKDWDLRYDADSKGAYLFEIVLQCLYHDVFALNGLGSGVVKYLSKQTGVFVDFYRNFDQVLLKPESKWFGDKGREEIFKGAIERALQVEVRTWGSKQRFMLSNIFFGGKLPPIAGFDRGPLVAIGGRATIHQGQLYNSDGRATSFIPTLKMITDMSRQEYHTSLLGGPSDRRFSKWYANEVGKWQKGQYKLISPMPAKKYKF